MNSRLTILLLALLTLGSLRAEQPDSLPLSRRTYERATLSRLPYLERADGVAVSHLRFRSSLSILGVWYHRRDENRPLIPELGQGASIAALGARTYLHPSDRETIWGDARYARGMRRGVRWCSTSDYDRLYPYVVADEEGGDMTHESYAFGGGYSRRLLPLLCLSGEVTYRSQQEYRTRDPRPRSIVSDLRVAGGVAYRLGAYDLGLSLSGGIYKQGSSVSFYSPLGVTQQYLMSGLGGSFKRFDTNTPALRYRGRELGVALHLLPRELGLAVSASYRHQTLEEALSDMNEVPIHHYRDHRGTTLLAYHRTSPVLRWGVELAGDASYRIGIEHIVGEPKAGTYPVVGYNPCFHRLLSDAAMTLHLSDAQPMAEGWHWTLRPALTYHLTDTRILEPEKALHLQRWGGAVSVELAHLSAGDRYALLRLDLYGSAGVGGRLTLPHASMEPMRLQHIEECFDALSATQLGGAIGPRAFLPLHLAGMSCGVELGCRYRIDGYRHPSGHRTLRHRVEAMAQLTF